MIQTTFLGVGETANSSLMRQIGVDGEDFLGLPNSTTESDLPVVLLRSGVDSISPSIVYSRERMLIESLSSSRNVHAYGRSDGESQHCHISKNQEHFLDLSLARRRNPLFHIVISIK